MASGVFGWGNLAVGDSLGAVQAMSESVNAYRELEDRPGLGWALASLGTAQLRSGEPEAARISIIEGCVRSRATHLWVALNALECAADWLGAMGDPDSA